MSKKKYRAESTCKKSFLHIDSACEGDQEDQIVNDMEKENVNFKNVFQ